MFDLNPIYIKITMIPGVTSVFCKKNLLVVIVLVGVYCILILRLNITY